MSMIGKLYVSLHGHTFGLFKGLTGTTDVWGGGSNFQGMLDGVNAGLTAAGTTSADALQLTAAVNQISTAALNTGVDLPVGQIGMCIEIHNDGANPIKVYPAVADSGATIDGGSSATITNGRSGYFRCYGAGLWRSTGSQKAA